MSDRTHPNLPPSSPLSLLLSFPLFSYLPVWGWWGVVGGGGAAFMEVMRYWVVAWLAEVVVW